VAVTPIAGSCQLLIYNEDQNGKVFFKSELNVNKGKLEAFANAVNAMASSLSTPRPANVPRGESKINILVTTDDSADNRDRQKKREPSISLSKPSNHQYSSPYSTDLSYDPIESSSPDDFKSKSIMPPAKRPPAQNVNWAAYENKQNLGQGGVVRFYYQILCEIFFVLIV